MTPESQLEELHDQDLSHPPILLPEGNKQEGAGTRLISALPPPSKSVGLETTGPCNYIIKSLFIQLKTDVRIEKDNSLPRILDRKSTRLNSSHL